MLCVYKKLNYKGKGMYCIIAHLGQTQAKCRLLISSIFYVMNFQHFLEMLEFNLWYFLKMSEIHYIKQLEIKS